METLQPPGANTHLRNERIGHNWRQHELAELLGTSVDGVKRWEQGRQQPSAYFRAKLCTLFGKSAQQLGLLPEQGPLWSLPFARNPFFTGRQSLLVVHSLNML